MVSSFKPAWADNHSIDRLPGWGLIPSPWPYIFTPSLVCFPEDQCHWTHCLQIVPVHQLWLSKGEGAPNQYNYIKCLKSKETNSMSRNIPFSPTLFILVVPYAITELNPPLIGPRLPLVLRKEASGQRLEILFSTVTIISQYYTQLHYCIYQTTFISGYIN